MRGNKQDNGAARVYFFASLQQIRLAREAIAFVIPRRESPTLDGLRDLDSKARILFGIAEKNVCHIDYLATMRSPDRAAGVARSERCRAPQPSCSTTDKERGGAAMHRALLCSHDWPSRRCRL